MPPWYFSSLEISKVILMLSATLGRVVKNHKAVLIIIGAGVAIVGGILIWDYFTSSKSGAGTSQQQQSDQGATQGSGSSSNSTNPTTTSTPTQSNPFGVSTPSTSTASTQFTTQAGGISSIGNTNSPINYDYYTQNTNTTTNNNQQTTSTSISGSYNQTSNTKSNTSSQTSNRTTNTSNESSQNQQNSYTQSNTGGSGLVGGSGTGGGAGQSSPTVVNFPTLPSTPFSSASGTPENSNSTAYTAPMNRVNVTPSTAPAPSKTNLGIASYLFSPVGVATAVTNAVSSIKLPFGL